MSRTADFYRLFHTLLKNFFSRFRGIWSDRITRFGLFHCLRLNFLWLVVLGTEGRASNSHIFVFLRVKTLGLTCFFTFKQKWDF